MEKDGEVVEGQILKQIPHDKLAKKLESFKEENIKRWSEKAQAKRVEDKEWAFASHFLRICEQELKITKEQIQVLSLEELKELEERIAKKKEKILRRARIALISVITAYTLPLCYVTIFVDGFFFLILCFSFIISMVLISLYCGSLSKEFLTARRHLKGLKGEEFSPEYIKRLIEKE